MRIRTLTPIATEIITISNTAIGFTAATIRNGGYPVERAYCSIEGGMIRHYETGDDPTDTEGHPEVPISSFIIDGWDSVRQFKAIRVGSVDATLTATYFSYIDR